MTYTTIQHPKSGEVYAAQLDRDGHILRAAGPLASTDSRDPDSLRDWIDNSFDADEDGAWLNEEMVAQ